MTAPRGVPAGPGRRLWRDCAECGGDGQERGVPDAFAAYSYPCPACGGRGVVAVDLSAQRRRIANIVGFGVLGRNSYGEIADAVLDVLTGEGTDGR